MTTKRSTPLAVKPAPQIDDPATSHRVVTSYDVARHAGVSQSAVSRCFTPGASVSRRMRARIERAAEELGYQPNAIARMLFTKRTNLIAVIVSNLGVNPDFTDVLGHHMVQHGLNLLFFALSQDADADRAIEQLLQYRVDGVISAAELSADQIGVLRERELPLVFINRSYEASGANSVGCDHAEGERLLVDRLYDAGHRRFAIVAGPEDSVVSRLRSKGALDRLASLGAPTPRIVTGDFTYDSGRAAMTELFHSGEHPDAVLCANDLMAIGCIDEARSGLSLSVPEQVSVVGFDGSAPGQWESYRLTTVRQPIVSMVKAAVDMLVARIDDPSIVTEKRMFSGDLIIGRSARLR